MPRFHPIGAFLAFGAIAPALGGCALFSEQASLSDRECMTRVMYFESNRSSEDGMLAVGTTVMNRLESGKYPRTVCGVVGQRGQFAEGVLRKPMNPRQAARVAAVADRVLAGDRHPQVAGAMFFHTAGYSFPYTNMHYVAVAGGNAFYEKIPRARWAPPETAVARVEPAAAPIAPLAETQPPRSIDDILTDGTNPAAPPREVAAVDWSSDDPGRY